MIRLLLSLLALVSGLAVQGVPAQASVCANCEAAVGAQAVAPEAALGAIRVVALTVAHRAPAVQAMEPAFRLPALRIAARPGVLIGIDRARQ